MLKISMNKIRKYYGTRLILDIDEFKICESDRIGIVGINGVGKTTLLEIISKQIDYDSGELLLNSNTAIKYVPQLGEPNVKRISGKYASIFQVHNKWDSHMSGGEKTRFKLAEGFENSGNVLLVDEPTNNLDIDGIKLVIDNFNTFNGALVVVSHDRYFLDSVCNKILEIENSKCKVYDGNYSKYLKVKEMEIARQEIEYKEFVKEKSRLANLKREMAEKSARVRTTPSRMGNSEARLHKMGGQSNRAKLDRAAKSIEKRIEHLENRDKPIEQDVIKINIPPYARAHSKTLISGENLSKAFGEKVLFDNASFCINNGKKVALLGPNGSGKTTLIKMILAEENINISKNVRIGYFSQSMDVLDEKKTILENVMGESIHDEGFARLILARLLIKGDKVNQKLKILSGGEKVKVAFAKIILADINFLILDEPTNYLDISSLEVIENVLKNYDGTSLIVSHDIRFIENIADELLIIENKKITNFRGKYEDYLNREDKEDLNINKREVEEKIMVLDVQISSLISRISIEESKEIKKGLEEEYKTKMKELASLKQKLR